LQKDSISIAFAVVARVQMKGSADEGVTMKGSSRAMSHKLNSLCDMARLDPFIVTPSSAPGLQQQSAPRNVGLNSAHPRPLPSLSLNASCTVDEQLRFSVQKDKLTIRGYVYKINPISSQINQQV